MTEQVMKDIYRIPVPLPDNPLRELNAYLIRGGKGQRNLLIDTGFRRPECREALTGALEELRIDMHETDIFLTHLHSDHTGLAPDIATEDTHVYVDAGERDWLTGETRERLRGSDHVRFRRAGFSEEVISGMQMTHPGWGLAPDPAFDRYEIKREGDVLSVGAYRLELIQTPGHTPGQFCLWMEKEKTMFTADHVLFDITPNITQWPTMKDALGAYLESLDKVYPYPVELALPGHRKTGDFHARIEALRAHHSFRLDECEKIVRENPGLTPYDITGKMTWKIRAKNWQDFPDTQRWFAVGECLAHLDYLEARGRVRGSEDHGVLRYVG